MARDFFRGRYPSCHPTNSVNALKEAKSTDSNQLPVISLFLLDWLIDWLKVLRPTRHKTGHFGDVPKPISWHRMEKQNLTQQKHTFINQKKHTTIQTKTRFITHPTTSSLEMETAYSRFGAFWPLRTYLDTYPLTYSHGTHMGSLFLHHLHQQCQYLQQLHWLHLYICTLASCFEILFSFPFAPNSLCLSHQTNFQTLFCYHMFKNYRRLSTVVSS